MATIPNAPNTQQLKKRAKDLQRYFSLCHPLAEHRVQSFAPEFSENTKLKLGQAQLIIARELHCNSWAHLLAHIHQTQQGKVLVEQLYTAIEDNDTDLFQSSLHANMCAMNRSNDPHPYPDNSLLKHALCYSREKMATTLVQQGAYIHVYAKDYISDAQALHFYDLEKTIKKRHKQAQLLITYIRSENEASACALIHQDPSLSRVYEEAHIPFGPPLYEASKKGMIKLCTLLLKYNARTDAFFETTAWYPLTAARFHQHKPIIQLLEKHGAYSSHISDCFYAAAHGDTSRVQNYILSGFDPNSFDTCRQHLLSITFLNNRMLFHWLLDHGADINRMDSWNSHSHMHMAIEQNRTDDIQQLLDAGYDPNQKNAWGWSPLRGAENSGNQNIINALLKAGASHSTPQTPPDYEHYNIAEAVLAGDYEDVRALLQQYPSLIQSNKAWGTSLLELAEQSHQPHTVTVIKSALLNGEILP